MIPQRQQLINQEETDNQMTKISDALKLIFKSQTKNLSYQKTYHSVYRLCKQGLHQELAGLVMKKTGEYFKDCVDSLIIREGYCGDDISNLIVRLLEANQRIMEVFLYLQANHRQRQGVPSLRTLLNNLLFQSLRQRKQIMEQFVKEIADLKINQDFTNSKNLLAMISKIDEKQIFIPQLFLPIYIPKMKAFYQQRAYEKITNCTNLGQFIEWASNLIDNEKNFIVSILQTNKVENKKLLENVLTQLYNVCVSKNKELIYNKNPKSLFMEYTPKLLGLFSKVDNDDIRYHTDWYIGIVRNELNMLPKTHNQEFLELFIKIYKKISEYLQGTLKQFNITYKVKFVFEEWINDERINIPNRLNHYIDGSLQEYSKEKQNINFDRIVENCGIIFKLLKKKDQFERGYRKALIKRTINKKFTDPQSETKLLAIMAQECGAQWIQKINNLKQSIMTHTNIRQSSYQRINCLVFQQTAWPFEKQNFNALICNQLIGLGSEFENKYLQQNKRKKLTFHPVLGTVKMSIKFENQSLMLMVDTGMANLIIFYKNKNRAFKLDEFVKQRYYTHQQIKESLNRLLKSQLFVSKNGLLELNMSYQNVSGSKSMKNISNSSNTIDLTHEENYDPMQCDEMEQLRADRKMMVEAMLVKIMKSSKVANKTQIMTKIVPMIQAKGFKFNEQFVESSITRLIDKDFIRDFQDGTYGYIA